MIELQHSKLRITICVYALLHVYYTVSCSQITSQVFTAPSRATHRLKGGLKEAVACGSKCLQSSYCTGFVIKDAGKCKLLDWNMAVSDNAYVRKLNQARGEWTTPP